MMIKMMRQDSEAYTIVHEVIGLGYGSVGNSKRKPSKLQALLGVQGRVVHD